MLRPAGLLGATRLGPPGADPGWFRKKMARPTGFEPVTPAFGGMTDNLRLCSIKPTLLILSMT